MWILRLTLLLIGTLACVDARAQGADVWFHRLTVGAGLPQTFVTSVARDSLGFVWFGTAGGLARYDGYDFDVFEPDPDDPRSLPDPIVTALRVASDGTLWVGFEGAGVARFVPETQQFERVPVEANAPAHTRRVNCLYEADDGAIWVGTADGLIRIDPGSGAAESLRDGVDFPVSALAATEGGGLWAVSRGRLYHTAPGARSLRRRADVGAIVWALHERDGQLWMGTEDGLAMVDVASGAVTRPPDAALRNPTHALFAEPNGWLWLATDAGFVLFDMASERVLTVRSNAPGNPINLPGSAPTDVLYDASGMFWIATSGGGAVYTDFQTSRFPIYRSLPGDPASLASPSVRSIASDRLSIWVGLDGAGLNRIDRATGRVTRLPLPAAPPSLGWPAEVEGTVFGLSRDRSGTLWSVVHWGVRRHDSAGQVERVYPFPDQASAAFNPGFVHEDRAGRLWVGAGHVMQLDPDTGDYTVVPGSADGLAVYEAPEGALWIATDDGLMRYDPDTGAREAFRHDPGDPTSLSSGQTISLAAQGDSVLWVGTVAGLNRFDLATRRAVRHTRSNSGLPSNYVNGVLVDDAGRVWISTNRGLARLDPATQLVTSVGERRSLQGLEFNRGASHKAADGTLMFGGISGLNVFDPAQLRENPHPPEVRLKRVVAGAEVLVPGPGAVGADALRVRPDQDELAFEYVGLHYSVPMENRYRYWLEGHDQAWGPITADREVRYTNLDPGTYTFHLRAANAYGVWSDDVALVTVVVPPAWWETWWFTVLLGGLVVGMVWGAYAWRTNDLRLRERRLRIDVASRTSALAREQARTERQAGELARLNDQLRQLFANVSHETRTPLTLILGPVEDVLADADAEIPTALRRTLGGVRSNARRLMLLVDQILDLSRLEAGQTKLRLQRVDLAAFVATLAVAFEEYAEGRGLAFSWAVPEAPVVGAFDVALLEHVLFNLVANAVKYTPEGGKVRVSLSVEAEGDDRVAALRVRDTGVGIPADQLDRIWDRFALATEGQASSTGLGLALVKEAIDLHGGTAGVESRRGFGTTFTVRLPLADSAEGPVLGGDYAPRTHLPEVARSAPEVEAPAETDRTTVLVVEDAPDVRAYVASVLRPAYRVREAAHGQAALTAIREDLPDVVVSDVSMPVMDGFALCAAIKGDPALRTVPVILLTARAEAEDRLAGLELGADDYLAKPFDARELRARVANLVASRRAWRDAFTPAPLPPVVDAFPEAVSADDALRRQIEEAIHERFSDASFSASDLAEAVGLSGSQLRRRTRELMGQAPTDLIRSYRLSQAAHQLAKRTGTVSEVAYAVGFNSVSYFSRSFRDVFGHPPSEVGDGA